MKQSLQSIKFNVVDQEVANIHTQTSDQGTESDYYIDFNKITNARVSGSLKSYRPSEVV